MRKQGWVIKSERHSWGESVSDNAYMLISEPAPQHNADPIFEANGQAVMGL